MYDNSFVLPNPVVATSDGSTLLPYVVAPPTVEVELSKVAFGRNIDGVHWRSDGMESLKLGEQVAIELLRDTQRGFNENFAGFSFPGFGSETITIA